MIDRIPPSLRRILPFAALLLAALMVGGGSGYVVTVGTVTAIWAILAIALNFMMGYTGLINLGIGAFYALGAYGEAILQTRHGAGPWVGAVVMPIAGFVIALALGPAVLRTRGLHFAVATLGIGIIVSDVLDNWLSVTKGPIGIAGITRPGPIGIGSLRIDPSTNGGFFALVVLLLAGVVVVASLFHRSRLARVLVAVRDDELLAKSLGFSVTAQKVVTFALSGALATFAGVVYAWFIRYISPPPFGFFAASFPAFVLVAVGGAGTVWGPVVGAAVLTAFPELVHLEPNTKLIVYGLVLLAVIVLLPRGIAPSLLSAPSQLGRRLRRSGQAEEVEHRPSHAGGNAQPVHEGVPS